MWSKRTCNTKDLIERKCNFWFLFLLYSVEKFSYQKTYFICESLFSDWNLVILFLIKKTLRKINIFWIHIIYLKFLNNIKSFIKKPSPKICPCHACINCDIWQRWNFFKENSIHFMTWDNCLKMILRIISSF